MEVRLKLQIYGRGGLEVKLNQTFTAECPIMHMMRQFLRDLYSWHYTGEQETVQQEDKGEGNLFLPNLLFPPLRFQNTKFGIGKNWQK